MPKLPIILIPLMVLLSTSQLAHSQPLPIPDGRRLRDIVADNCPEGNLLIGATTGSWGFNSPIGEIMDREFSYVTPENDFKQSVVRSNPDQWDWARADAWLQHIIDHDQVLRIHGPISPQCSKWAKEDIRTAEELSEELDTFMTALCMRYNGVEGIKYLDVVNEIVLSDGRWFYPRPGTDDWENPWLLIGQDNDPNKTPLYVAQAFAIANEHAPDLKLVLNNHCHPGTAGMERVKETILYLRERGYRVDGLGWQAHVDVGWATEENLQELRMVIDWCYEQNVEFHITEFDAWITNPYTQTLEKQAYTYKAIMDILIKKQDSLTIGWNTWHITDAAGWQPERIPAVFDDSYDPKPAYYALQLALETMGDYNTTYDVTIKVKQSETGEIIEGCAITFNNETGYTGIDGELTFQPMSAGRYTLGISKEYMAPVHKGISIYSDTLLTILLEPALYEVSYHIMDEYNGSDLSNVAISIDTLNKETDLAGSATFNMTEGVYTASFSKSGFRDTLLEHHVISDTVVETGMEKTHGQIKFRIKNNDAPVNGALLVLDKDSLYTNALGICIFESIQIGSSLYYDVSKENYYPLSGELILRQDTTLNLQLSKSVANVEFVLDAESMTASKAYIVLEADSVWFNVNGTGKFYNLSLERDYDYQVISDNYPEYTGTLFLLKDTVVVVSLVNTEIRDAMAPGGTFIYPNPASDLLYIRSVAEIDFVEIVNSAGVVIKDCQLKDLSNQIDVSELHAGYYWVRLKKAGAESQIILPFLVQ